MNQRAKFTARTRAFTYISTTLPDDVFIQGGFLDSTSPCPNSFGRFVTILLPGGGHVGQTYNSGNCGLTGAHWFKIAISGQVDPYTFTWQMYLDGNPVGPSVDAAYSYFPKTNAGAVSEIVDTGVVGSSAPWPSTDYGPAIQLMPTSLSSFTDSNHGHFFHSTNDGYQCPPFYLHVHLDNNFDTGHDNSAPSGDCHAQGGSLW